ncbi:maleate isomerase [Bauldia litoralis]|uniref:Maleate isomerase n=2 Tax=Bauldia litoralis TaxID=665467 RepID=A0A1G6B9T6_9HYPH|nr:ectoine utilization protein EutA [Bauldia litoralis]SDB17406.1 maleate isomerase [Bauldia litoralis]
MDQTTEARAAVVLDDRPIARRIGLVVLSTDHTSERDFNRIIPREEAAVYANRIVFRNPTTPETLRAMEPGLVEGAALILPGEALDAICYSCTAASAVLGDAAVVEAVARGKPDVPVVTPPMGARRAFAALGVTRISILTPYLDETAAPVAAYFRDHGFIVDRLTNLGLDDDRDIARVATGSIVDAARDALDERSEGLFISCTALRAVEVVATIEAACGVPVVTSNQASAWMCLRLAGIDRPIAGYGRLLSLPLPD